MNSSALSAAILLFFGILPLAAVEVPYSPGTGWRVFTFELQPGGGLQQNVEGEFSFTVYPGQNAVLTITDCGWNNERILVYNKGNLTPAWYTSYPGPAGQVGKYWTTSYDVAAAGNSIWGSSNQALAPGTYKLAFALGYYNTEKWDEAYGGVYRGAFKVDIVQTPDADHDKIADPVETGTGVYVSPVNTGTDPSKADTDGDGIDDWTEISGHKTDPTKADTDGDGFWDLAEIQAGKSPLNPTHNPDAAMEARMAVEVTLYTKAGTSYQVEWSDDLETWTLLPEVIVGDGNPVTKFYSTREHPNRYFRATKQPAQ